MDSHITKHLTIYSITLKKIINPVNRDHLCTKIRKVENLQQINTCSDVILIMNKYPKPNYTGGEKFGILTLILLSLKNK